MSRKPTDRQIEITDYAQEHSDDEAANKYGVELVTVRRYKRAVLNYDTQNEQDVVNSSSYFYDEDNDVYAFAVDNTIWRFDSETLEDMKTAYSSFIGQGMTIKDVCTEFDIPVSVFNTIRYAMSWVHDMPDYLEQDAVGKDPAELARKSVQKFQDEKRWRQSFEKESLKAIYRDYKKLKKQEYYINKGLESLKEHVAVLSKTPPNLNLQIQKDDSKYTYVLCLADFHEQLRIYGEEMMHGMSYDKSIRKDIIQTLLSAVYTDVKENWNFDFKKSIFLDVGDSLDGLYGSTISGTPRDRRDSYGLEAVDSVEWVYDAMITGMYDIFRKLDVRYVPGNHEGAAISHLMFRLMKERYQNFEDINIDTHKKFFYSFVEGMNQFVLYHGKHPGFRGRAVNARDGSKRESDIKSLFMATKQDYARTNNHYFLQGDLHAMRSTDNGIFEEKILPTVSPPDNYAESMGYFARPSILAFVLSDDEGIVMERRYYYDSDREV